MAEEDDSTEDPDTALSFVTSFVLVPLLLVFVWTRYFRCVFVFAVTACSASFDSRQQVTSHGGVEAKA